MRTLVIAYLLLCFAFGCSSDHLSRAQIVALARASLSKERKEAFPDVTEVIRKDHVQSWMVVFENTKHDNGAWVMIDDQGQFVDGGRLYADH